MRPILLILTCTTLINVTFLCGCQNSSEEKPAFYAQDEMISGAASTAEFSENQEASSGEIVSVPYYENNGLKIVEVNINRAIGVDMILDSGCTNSFISINEANYLYNKGVLTIDDIKGSSSSHFADGRIEENMLVNLREVIIGNKIVCYDVEATISSNPKAPLLLGNDILNRVASYEIDNSNKVINFKIR